MSCKQNRFWRNKRWGENNKLKPRPTLLKYNKIKQLDVYNKKASAISIGIRFK